MYQAGLMCIQGRARPSLAKLYNWRYQALGDLPAVIQQERFRKANAGLAYDYQFIGNICLLCSMCLNMTSSPCLWLILPAHAWSLLQKSTSIVASLLFNDAAAGASLMPVPLPL